MEEAEWKEEQVDEYYYKAIKNEISRGVYNLERLEIRRNSHEKLMVIIKNMLLENTLPISERIFDNLKVIQEKYHNLDIKPLDYDQLKEQINNDGKAIVLNLQTFMISYESWKKIASSLKSIQFNVILDNDMEIKINNMIEELEKDK
ncbi:hypothetical protein [Staphylococcus aureus]